VGELPAFGRRVAAQASDRGQQRADRASTRPGWADEPDLVGELRSQHGEAKQRLGLIERPPTRAMDARS
jgi:hypothetical protein